MIQLYLYTMCLILLLQLIMFCYSMTNLVTNKGLWKICQFHVKKSSFLSNSEKEFFTSGKINSTHEKIVHKTLYKFFTL